MNSIALTPSQLDFVRSVLAPYHRDFHAFGSRVKGTARPLSDLDILSKLSLTKLQISVINEAFEESSLPFKVDLVLWDDMDSTFQNRITSDLRPLFT
jgi:predicted nucleotidyltransferase